MAQKKAYDKEYKIQAVKLGREIRFSRAAAELGISVDTLYGWNKKAKSAELGLGPGTKTPEASAFSQRAVGSKQEPEDEVHRHTEGMPLKGYKDRRRAHKGKALVILPCAWGDEAGVLLFP